MKKIIALLLALVMTFSVATIAFAADETVAPETETTAPSGEGEAEGEGEFDLGDFGFIMDLPLWTAKPMLKVAKIALKLIKVVVKVGAVFGMDPGEIIEAVTSLIEKTQGETAPEEGTTEPATTAAVA